MSVVKYFPSEEQSELIAILKKHSETHLSAKVVKNHGKGLVDLVVNVPGSENKFVEKVSNEKNASPRYEVISAKKK